MNAPASISSAASPRLRRSSSILLLLAGLLAGLLGAELLVRTFAPQALWFPWAQDGDGLTVLRPGAAGRHFVPGAFDKRERIGPLGFRGAREFPVMPADGRVRIAVLGDSFAYGVGADDDETLPARLQESLAHERVEIINAGIPGTSTGEQALYFERYVSSFRPQVVVLAVTLNDVGAGTRTPMSSSRWVRRLPGYAWLTQNSHLLGLIRSAASRGMAARAGDASEPDDKAYHAFQAELTNLARAARRQPARFAAVLLPERDSVYAGAAESDPLRNRMAKAARAMSEVCSQEQIPCLDTTAALRAAARTSAHPLYYQGNDTHPTPAGYAAMARALGEFLIREQLLVAARKADASAR